MYNVILYRFTLNCFVINQNTYIEWMIWLRFTMAATLLFVTLSYGRQIVICVYPESSSMALNQYPSSLLYYNLEMPNSPVSIHFLHLKFIIISSGLNLYFTYYCNTLQLLVRLLIIILFIEANYISEHGFCQLLAIFDQSSIYHGLNLHIWQNISDGTYVSSRFMGDLLTCRKWNLCHYTKLDLFHRAAIMWHYSFINLTDFHYISIYTEASNSVTETYALIFILDTICPMMILNTICY